VSYIDCLKIILNFQIYLQELIKPKISRYFSKVNIKYEMRKKYGLNTSSTTSLYFLSTLRDDEQSRVVAQLKNGVISMNLITSRISQDF